MDFYIVRDVDTGLCMPFTKKGQTHVELEDPLVKPPRLFTTKRGASLAITAWLKGRHKASWDWPDGEYACGGAYVDGFDIIAQPKRKQCKLEPVKAHLHLEI